MTNWEKFLERRKANIGFISRGKAFRDPSPYEKDSALIAEIASWQKTKGKVNYKISDPYSIPRGKGINLLATRECEEPIKGVQREKAISAYIKTPIDQDGILKSLGIDTEQFNWKEVGIFRAFIYWITGRKVRRIK